MSRRARESAGGCRVESVHRIARVLGRVHRNRSARESVLVGVGERECV